MNTYELGYRFGTWLAKTRLVSWYLDRRAERIYKELERIYEEFVARHHGDYEAALDEYFGRSR